MQLVRYDAAKQAIAEYRTVDEVKDFRDKALAIEAYAKQANDYELERDAAVARVRAERRCGELLAEMDKAKGGRPIENRSHDSTGFVAETKTLSDLGITKDQSSKWQKLAAVPEAEFEAAVSQPGIKPSTHHILTPKEDPPPRMDAVALWFWGRLLDMERNNLFSRSAESLISEMTEAMQQDAHRLLPKLRSWLL